MSIHPPPPDLHPEMAGVTARQRRLLIAIAAILFCVLFVWNIGPNRPDVAEPELDGTVTESPILPGPSLTYEGIQPLATQSPLEPSHQPVSERRTYALGLHELAGLPPDPSPGIRFELWVTWDPPLTDSPKLQRLIRDVLIAEVIPPLTPEGPTAVVVSVPLARIGDLIYADRYGSLSVSLTES